MRIKQNIFFQKAIALLIAIVIQSFSISVNAQDTKIKNDSTQSEVDSDIQEGHDLYSLIQSDPRNKEYLDMSKQGWISGLGDNSYLRFGGFLEVNFIKDLPNRVLLWPRQKMPKPGRTLIN